MPFIGTQPEVGGYSVLDALTASATASYTLQKDSANFSPSSANQLLVSLNGVIQKPGSSFTVSGSTLTFSSALTSSDSIDFILAMGEPLLVGTPSDGAVNTTQLATNAVTTAKITDANITQAKLGSGVAGTGPAFSAHLSGNPGLTANTYTKMACNTELFDTDNCYDTSNYRFTPTVAGIYHCTVHVKVYTATNQTSFGKIAAIYKNGSIMEAVHYSNYGTYTSYFNDLGNANAGYYTMALNVLVDANSTDYFELYGRHNIGGNSGGLVDKYFGAIKIIE